MDYRVLVLDLDGTTLNADGALEERDVAAALALQRAGVHVTIATGRLFTGSQWVARALGVRGAIAVMNGSELIDANSGQVVQGRYLAPAQRLRAREAWADHGLESGILFGSRRIHLGRRDERLRTYLETWTRDLTFHDDVYAATEWGGAEDVVAMGTIGEEDVVRRARDVLHEELPDEIGSVTFQTMEGDTFLKFRHAEETKGTALHRLAEERGVTAEQCVAVGDWLNDLPMLETAGLSLAMRSSPEAVREAAHEELESLRFGGGAVAEVARRVWGVQV